MPITDLISTVNKLKEDYIDKIDAKYNSTMNVVNEYTTKIKELEEAKESTYGQQKAELYNRGSQYATKAQNVLNDQISSTENMAQAKAQEMKVKSKQYYDREIQKLNEKKNSIMEAIEEWRKEQEKKITDAIKEKLNVLTQDQTKILKASIGG